MVDPHDRYATGITRVEVTPADDPGSWPSSMEELGLPESLREIVLAGWKWEFCDFGGGVRTLDAWQLNERTDEELLGIRGMTQVRLRAVRKAVMADLGMAGLAGAGLIELRPVP